MIGTDAAKGKAALGSGRTWKRKRENVVLERTVGMSPLIGWGGGVAVYLL
jgi:hypothetical protein